MKEYFHLFSNGEDAKDLILSDADYTAAFNRIGICAAMTGVTVLGFSIESTHIHCLMYAEQAGAEAFKKQYHLQTTMFISKTRSDRSGAVFNLEMYSIDSEDYLKNVAAYVITQPTKDGRPVMFYDYHWGTGSMYFRPSWFRQIWCEEKPLHEQTVGSLSQNRRRALFHTKSDAVPDDWIVCDGLILPSNYVDVAHYERIFRTHNAFRCFCASGRDKDKVVLDRMASARGVELEEEEMRLAAKSICTRMFGTNDLRSLSAQNRILIGRELRKTYGICYSQLSRRVYIPEYELRKYIR